MYLCKYIYIYLVFSTDYGPRSFWNKNKKGKNKIICLNSLKLYSLLVPITCIFKQGKYVVYYNHIFGYFYHFLSLSSSVSLLHYFCEVVQSYYITRRSRMGEKQYSNSTIRVRK